MRNLEDPRIKKIVSKVMDQARALGLPATKTIEAALIAYSEALQHPGSLIRVTSRTDDESERVLESLSGADRDYGRIDWVKTVNATAEIEDSVRGLAFNVEFKNGSAIELRVGK